MSNTIKVVVALVGLQVVAIFCLAATKQKQQMDDLTLAGKFIKLNRTLVEKVQSNDVGENLAAARELIANQTKSSCLSFFPKKENDFVKVTKGFVHLLEVASQPDVKCRQETLENLADYSRGHRFQVVGDADKDTGRVHLDLFGRVDELIDPRLEIILAKCSQFYDEAHQQFLNKLSPSVKKQVEDMFSDSVVDLRVDMRQDLRIIATTLAKKLDFANYKSALEAKDQERFEQYFKAFYTTHLMKPCRVYCEHFKRFYDIIRRILDLNRLYMIPVEHSKQFGVELARYYDSYFGAQLYDEDYNLSKMSREILKNYETDVKFGQVDWRSTEKRSLWGRRLY